MFIKWLTDAEQNMKFVANTGYLPVTKQAFETELPAHMDTVEDPRIKKMLTSVLAMYEDYTFFTAPNYSTLDAESSAYEKNFKSILSDAHTKYISGQPVSAEDALAEMRK